ncbi:MAG: DUF58 domain-containing protein, partial [Angelakisella sp.]
MSRPKKPQKAAGWLYIPFCAAVLIAALYFGAPPLWIFFIALATCGVLDLAILLFSMGAFEFSQSLGESEVERTMETSLLFTVKRSAAGKYCHVVLRVPAPRGKTRAVALLGERMKLPIKGNAVGEIAVGIPRAYVYSPLFIFALCFRQSALLRGYPRRLLVLPRELSLEAPAFTPLWPPLKLENDISRGAVPDTVCGNRNYVAGDPLKSVNWKLSAARRQLYVKEFDGTGQEHPATLFMGDFPPDMLQIVSEAALACGSFLLHTSGIALSYDGVSLPFERGALRALSRGLARLKPSDSADVQKQNAKLSELCSKLACGVVLCHADSETAEISLHLPRGS